MGSSITVVFAALQDFLNELQEVGCVSHAALSLVLPSGAMPQAALAACIKDLLLQLESQLNRLQEESSSKTSFDDPAKPAFVYSCSSIQDGRQDMPSRDVTGSIPSSTSSAPSTAAKNNASVSTSTRQGSENEKVLPSETSSSLQECENKLLFREKDKLSCRELVSRDVSVDIVSTVQSKDFYGTSPHCGDTSGRQEVTISVDGSCQKACSKISRNIPEINFCTCLRLSKNVSPTPMFNSANSSDKSIQSHQRLSLQGPKILSSHPPEDCLPRKALGCVRAEQNHRTKVVQLTRSVCSTVSTFTSPGLAEALLGLSSSSPGNRGYGHGKGAEITGLDSPDESLPVKEETEVLVAVSQKHVSKSDMISLRRHDSHTTKHGELFSSRNVSSISRNLPNRDANGESYGNTSGEQQTNFIPILKSNEHVAMLRPVDRLCNHSVIVSVPGTESTATVTPSTSIHMTASLVSTPPAGTACLLSIGSVNSTSIQSKPHQGVPSGSLLVPVPGARYHLSAGRSPLTRTLSNSQPIVKLGNIADRVQLNSSTSPLLASTPMGGVSSPALRSAACSSTMCVLPTPDPSDISRVESTISHNVSCDEHEHGKLQVTPQDSGTTASWVPPTQELQGHGLQRRDTLKEENSGPLSFGSAHASNLVCTTQNNQRVNSIPDIIESCQNYQTVAEDSEKAPTNAICIVPVSKHNSFKIYSSAAELQPNLRSQNTVLVQTPCLSTANFVSDNNDCCGSHTSNQSLFTTRPKDEVKVPTPQKNVILENNFSKEASSFFVPYPTVRPAGGPADEQKLSSSMKSNDKVTTLSLVDSSGILSHNLDTKCLPQQRTGSQISFCSEPIRTIDALASVAAIPSTIDGLCKPLAPLTRNLTSDIHSVANADDAAANDFQSPCNKTTSDLTLIPTTNVEHNYPIAATLHGSVDVTNTSNTTIDNSQRTMFQYPTSSLVESYSTTTPLVPNNPDLHTPLPITTDRVHNPGLPSSTDRVHNPCLLTSTTDRVHNPCLLTSSTDRVHNPCLLTSSTDKIQNPCLLTSSTDRVHNPGLPSSTDRIQNPCLLPPSIDKVYNPILPTLLPATTDRVHPPPPASSPHNISVEPQQGPLSELPVFCCKICSTACPTMDVFTSHVCRAADDGGMEEDVAEEQLPLDYDSTSTHQPSSLVTKEEELRRMRRFTCAVCGVEFRALRRIVCHLARCRSGPYACPACGTLYTTRTALHHHMKTQHRREKCHTCPECGKSFERRTSLEKHLIKWHEDTSARGPFRCDACPKKFIRRIYLTNHKLRMHKLDKKFLCQCCGRRFLGAASLAVHEKEVHGPTPRPFACTLCDKTFAKKEKLVFHIRWHSGERPYVCTVCGLGFVSTSKLNEHVTRRHQPPHARRRYHCPHCDKSYANCSDLKKHARRIHDSELTPAQCIPSIAPSAKAQQQQDGTEQGGGGDGCPVDNSNEGTLARVVHSEGTHTINKTKKTRTSSAKPAPGRKRKRGHCAGAAPARGPDLSSEQPVLPETESSLTTVNLPGSVREVNVLSDQPQPGSLTGEVASPPPPPPLPVQHHQLLQHYHQQQQQPTSIQVPSNILIPHLTGDQPQQQVFCSMQNMLPQTIPALFHVLQHSTQQQQQLHGLSMAPSFNTYLGAGHPSSAVDHPGLHSVASAVAASAPSILEGGNTTVLYSNASVVLPSSVVVNPSMFHHHTVGALAGNTSHINGAVVMPGGQTSILLSNNNSSGSNSTIAGHPNSLSLLPGGTNVHVPPTPIEYASSTSHHPHLQEHRQARVYEFIPPVEAANDGSGMASALPSNVPLGSLPPG